MRSDRLTAHQVTAVPVKPPLAHVCVRVSAIPHAMRPRLTWTIGLLRDGRRERFADEVVDAVLNQDPNISLARRGAVERIMYALFHALGPLEAAQYEQNTLRLFFGGRSLESAAGCHPVEYPGLTR